MSYRYARKCFEENTVLLDSQANPVEWNLNNGLMNLTNAIEADLDQMRQALKAILEALNRR